MKEKLRGAFKILDNINYPIVTLSSDKEKADEVTGLFKKAIPVMRPNFKKVSHWTSPFCNAYDSARSKIGEAIDEEKVDSTGHYEGVLSFYSEGQETIVFYCFDLHKEGFKNVFLAWFEVGYLVAYVIHVPNETFYEFVADPLINDGYDYNWFLSEILLREIFKKYCEIETKTLKAKTTEKIFNCKYENDTSRDVEIINSTWFTNLVKSEGFKVRGHFRLQPKKKEGEWTKELIWISDFEKTGYTAPARKIIQYE